MSTVLGVYRSATHSCGIYLFNRHLLSCLRSKGYEVREHNTLLNAPTGCGALAIHYVPSMWAGDGGTFEEVITRASSRRTVVLMHGMYGPVEEDYMAETRCPELSEHVRLIRQNANTVITLSRSCTRRFLRWKGVNKEVNLLTALHPGVFRRPKRKQVQSPYVLLGGVIRAKKDVRSRRIQALLETCSSESIRIWVHSSNQTGAACIKGAWRSSSGLVSDSAWSNMVAGARVVLFPYHTQLQCVSGMMAEAISLGKIALASPFPFSEELRSRYPDYVVVEEDLERWPMIIRDLYQVRLPKPVFATWGGLAELVAGALSGRENPPENSLSEKGRISRRQNPPPIVRSPKAAC